MSRSDLFMDFMEGNLSDEDKFEFSQKMAFDESFQRDFKAYIAISRAAKDSLRNYAPTYETDSAIFSALGYSLPGSEILNTGSKVIDILKLKSVQLLFMAAIGILGGIGFGYFAFKSDNNSVNLTSQRNATTPDRKVESSFAGSIKPNSATELNQTNTIKNKRLNSVSSNLQTNDESEISKPLRFIPSISEDKTAKPEWYQLQNLAIINNKLEFAGFIQTHLNYSNSYSIPKINNLPDWNTLSLFSGLGLTLELTGSINKYLPTHTIDPAKTNPLNNTAVGVYYGLGKGFDIGVDFRAENFYVKYNGVESGQEFIYEQRPNFFSYGVTGKYKLFEISDFNEKICASIANNNYGYIIRTGLETDYNLFDDIDLQAKFEYSLLRYQHQNQGFNAEKISGVFGVAYKF